MNEPYISCADVFYLEWMFFSPLDGLHVKMMHLHFEPTLCVSLLCFRHKVVLQERGFFQDAALRLGYLYSFPPVRTHTAPIINIFIEISHGPPHTVYSNRVQLVDHQQMSVVVRRRVTSLLFQWASLLSWNAHGRWLMANIKFRLNSGGRCCHLFL